MLGGSESSGWLLQGQVWRGGGWDCFYARMLVIETFWELGSLADFPPRCSPSPRPGIRSWHIDPGICSLDEQLKVFVSRHSATFSSIVKGEAWDPMCSSCSPSLGKRSVSTSYMPGLGVGDDCKQQQ